MAQTKTVLVVGGGIVGLTTARALQSKGASVIVKCAKRAAAVTSAGSGGFWMLFRAAGDDLIRWAEESLAIYDDDESGLVEKMPAFSLFAAESPPREPPAWGRGRANLRVVAGRAALERELEAAGIALPPGYASAFAFDTVVVDSPRYCEHLERRIAADGGQLTRGEQVTDLVEAARACGADTVVNCAGLRGAELAKDDHFDVVPGRGVLLQYARPHDGEDKRPRAVVTTEEAPLATFTEPAYLIPRNDVVLVGGSYGEGDADTVPAPEELARLRRNAAAYSPHDLATAEPLASWVGHRPVRKAGVRVEIQTADETGVTVAHNYGHGGSGFTIAWGCAHDIADAIVGFRLKPRTPSY